MDRVKIKEKARKLIKDKLWEVWKPMLLVSLISFVIGLIFGAIDPNGENAFVGTLATVSTIFLYPLTIGVYKYYLNFVRGKELDIKEIFSPYKKLGGIILIYLLMYIIIGLWTLLFIIPGIIVSFSYVMVVYLMAEDDIDGMNTLRKSANMMNGYKMDYFVFSLSFILWILSVIFTFGLTIIYVGPYITISQTLYYEELKKINKKKKINK